MGEQIKHKWPITAVRVDTVKSVLVEYSDHLSRDLTDKDRGRDYVSLTAWGNGEGYDVRMERAGDTPVKFEITHSEYDALKQCMKEILKA